MDMSFSEAIPLEWSISINIFTGWFGSVLIAISMKPPDPVT